SGEAGLDLLGAFLASPFVRGSERLVGDREALGLAIHEQEARPTFDEMKGVLLFPVAGGENLDAVLQSLLFGYRREEIPQEFRCVGCHSHSANCARGPHGPHARLDWPRPALSPRATSR